MEWGSNLCTMLILILMLKDLVSLIHGVITLDYFGESGNLSIYEAQLCVIGMARVLDYWGL
jgi:hypothetical protein